MAGLFNFPPRACGIRAHGENCHSHPQPRGKFLQIFPQWHAKPGKGPLILTLIVEGKCCLPGRTCHVCQSCLHHLAVDGTEQSILQEHNSAYPTERQGCYTVQGAVFLFPLFFLTYTNVTWCKFYLSFVRMEGKSASMSSGFQPLWLEKRKMLCHSKCKQQDQSLCATSNAGRPVWPTWPTPPLALDWLVFLWKGPCC